MSKGILWLSIIAGLKLEIANPIIYDQSIAIVYFQNGSKIKLSIK